jgi:hypothetical protein
MRALSKDEIFEAMGDEEMATIYKPIRPDGQLTREEAGANTWNGPSSARHPLTPEELEKINETARSNPQHSTHSQQNAERSKKLAEQTEQRRLAAVEAERAKKSQ